MANLAHPQYALAELGGKHLQNHKLIHDTPNTIRYSDQRSSSDDTAQGSTHHTGGRGSGQSASEEVADEEDDEDSSASQEDDPDVLAPSHGRGKGKGKRPAICVEPADDVEPLADDETASYEAGPSTSKHPVKHLDANKKRTFSDVSSTSLLFGEDDTNQHIFPRPKVARTLSHSGGTGLLAYKPTDEEHTSGFENAIESSDEDAAARATDKQQDLDDEDYSGVNLISDSESDVDKMEQLEETFIIYDEQQHVAELFQEFNDARRLSLDSYGSDNFFDLDPAANSSFTPLTAQDIGFGQFFEPQPRPTSPEPLSKRKFSDSSTKRVRFDDEVQVPSSSSSSSSELDSALFPDLFLEQDKLPPSLYQLMEADNDTDHGELSTSASEHSYWDVGQDESRNRAGHDSDDGEDSSDPGSSGYETDMGDTTDEYDSDFSPKAPIRTPRNKSVLHRPSSAPASKAASPKPFQRSAVGPMRGIFVHEDSREAIAVTNRTTKTLTFYRPRASTSLRQPQYGVHSSSTSTANDSPRTTLQQLNVSDSELSNEVFTNALINSDIMLTGVFGQLVPNNYLFGDSIGPPEAFYPFVSIEQNGNVMSDEDEYEDDDDFENDLNIADFMDFGSDIDATDIEQEEEETDVPATPATSMIALNGSTPAQPTPIAETPLGKKRASSDAMLEHFDRAGVTAFRNNQNRYRDIACLPHDPNLRASVSRPIRSGRSAETLMSPLRKRGSISKKQDGSSIAGVTKASGRLQSSITNDQRGPRMGTFS